MISPNANVDNKIRSVIGNRTTGRISDSILGQILNDLNVQGIESVIDINSGLTTDIRDKVISAPGSPLLYEGLIYYPQNSGDGIPTIYFSLVADDYSYNEIDLDWVNLTISRGSYHAAPLNSPQFEGTPTSPTPSSGDNSTKIATTAFVQGTSPWEKGSIDSSAQLKNSSCVASGSGSVAEGYGTIAENSNSHAEGNQSKATGYISHAEGYNTWSTGGSGSHSEGAYSFAYGSSSHAEGTYLIASGQGSHAEGTANSYSMLSLTGDAGAITYTNSSNVSNDFVGGIVVSNDEKICAKVTSVSTTNKTITLDKTLSSTTAYSGTQCKIYGYYGGKATGDYSHHEGVSNIVSGYGAHGEGSYTHATGYVSHAEGSNSRATSYASHAEGSANANGSYSHAEGSGTVGSNGIYGHAEGNGTTNAMYAHSEGMSTTANAQHSHAEGSGTQTNVTAEHAEGTYNVSYPNQIHSVGIGTSNSARKNAHTITTDGKHYIPGIGSYTGTETTLPAGQDLATIVNSKVDTSNVVFEKGTGTGSAKLKNNQAVASGQYSTALGVSYNNTIQTAGADASIVEGAGNITKSGAQAAHAEGVLNVAGRTQEEAVAALADFPNLGGTTEQKVSKLIGFGSHSEGTSTRSLGTSSHAEGNSTQALVNATHAEGDTTTASGEAAHSEGYNTIASGNQAHAEGYYTKATANQSHAEGKHTEATSENAHAEGNYTTAHGNASHTEGYYTVTNNNVEHAEGQYNISIPNVTRHTVGIGNSSTRKNAHTITTDGKHYIPSVGGYEGTETTLTGKTDLATVINGKVDKVLMSKTYNPYTIEAATVAKGYLYFINVIPTSSNYFDSWHIKYRLYVTTTEQQTQGVYDCYISTAGTTCNYAVWNDFYSTTYRPIYNHEIAFYNSSTKYDNRSTYPIKIGARVYSARNDTSLARVFKVEVYEAYNCTVTLNDSIQTYDSFYNANYYGYASEINAAAYGLQETGDLDTTTTMQLYYSRLTAGTNGLKQYSLCMEDGDGNWQSFTTDAGAGTSKTKNPAGFRLGSPIYYLSMSGNVAAGSVCGNAVVRQNVSLVDLRYSLNIAANSATEDGLVRYKPVYIVGTIGADGLFYLDDTWWTQIEPTTEDGKIYIKITEAVYPDYDTNNPRQYRADLVFDGTPYVFKRGQFLPYENEKVVGPSSSTTNHIATYSDATGKLIKDSGADVDANGLLRSTALRASGANMYIGSESDSQCHMQYDTTNKCLKFIFD